MRINKYIAQVTGLSRRGADKAIGEGRVALNGRSALPGSEVAGRDVVSLDNQPLRLAGSHVTIILNKPAGYVCSRNGQGSATIYDLLPSTLHHLKPAGRLDKDSSGLLLLTNDGQLANKLTHPRYAKNKVYEIMLDKPLSAGHQAIIVKGAVELDDGPSGFDLKLAGGTRTRWRVTMQEGRNRQIRRTFAAAGYNVVRLHRLAFGTYTLDKVPTGTYSICNK